jgi:hypothetical protein
MDISQNDLERLIDLVQRGEITAEQANVQKVLWQRVLLVSKLPSDVRKALNAAVKRGELGHMKKEAHKPEAYFHPTFDYLARSERKKHELSVFSALAGVMARPFEI